MKKIGFIISLFLLFGCFEEVDNTLDRDSFIGNYNFSLACDDTSLNDSYIIFIEKPLFGADSLSSTIVFRNLLNKNQTVEAIVSDKDFILNDNKVIGSGTLDISNRSLSISFSFSGNDCSGTGALRK